MDRGLQSSERSLSYPLVQLQIMNYPHIDLHSSYLAFTSRVVLAGAHHVVVIKIAECTRPSGEPKCMPSADGDTQNSIWVYFS